MHEELIYQAGKYFPKMKIKKLEIVEERKEEFLLAVFVGGHYYNLVIPKHKLNCVA